MAARRVRPYAPVAVSPRGPLTEPGCRRRAWARVLSARPTRMTRSAYSATTRPVALPIDQMGLGELLLGLGLGLGLGLT